MNAKRAKKSEEPEQGFPTPRTNAELEGHSDTEQLLLDSFHSGRMHHAWLICGPKGIGKATLAHRMARYVLAHSTQAGGTERVEAQTNADGGLFGDDLPTDAPAETESPSSNALAQGPLWVDPETPVFQRISQGGHSDLMVLERTVDEKRGKLRSEILVGDVRPVGGFLNLTPAEGGWRVVVIDSADEMNTNAANALLKVLEEPPARALLLLVSHQPGRLLPTIRSRCRKIQVNALDENTVMRLLHHYAPDINDSDRKVLAALAEGSIGRALDLHDIGGVALYGEMRALLESLPNLNIAALHKLADKVGRAGAEGAFATLSTLLAWWLGRTVIHASGGTGAALDPVDRALAARLTGQDQNGAAQGMPMGLDRWFEVWEKINQLVAKTDTIHLDRKQVVLDLFLSLEKASRASMTT